MGSIGDLYYGGLDNSNRVWAVHRSMLRISNAEK